MTSSIERLRLNFGKGLIAFLWLNVGLVTALAVSIGTLSPWIAIGASVALAGTATLSWLNAPTATATRVSTSMSAAGLVAVVVFALSGHDFQIDMHMYFFAMLAIVAGWCDWRALVANAAVVALHHLALNFVLPSAVFSLAEPDLARVLVHATVLVVQTLVLAWMTEQLAATMTESQEAFAKAEASHREAELAQQAQVAAARQALEDRNREMQVLANRFEAAVGTIMAKVSDASKELQGTAQQLENNSRETTSRSAAAAAASEQSSNNVQTVASAAEQLNQVISEISTQVHKSSAVAARAVSEADQASNLIKGLAEAGKKIGSVVDLIANIASQTNLLALNATIEAARAGEAGKGFAVVAQEVKQLADQTAKATAEIAAQITAIQTSTDEASQFMGSIGATITEVNSIATSIASAVEEQSSATQEIARNVSEASAGAEDVARNIAGVQTYAETASKAASEVLASASNLARQSAELRTQATQFVATVRAA